jgi:hypothetical protein
VLRDLLRAAHAPTGLGRMTRRPRPAAVPLAAVDGDQAAALDRLRAAVGPVEVLAVRAHDPQPAQPPTSKPGPVQGRLLDQEATG